MNKKNYVLKFEKTIWKVLEIEHKKTKQKNIYAFFNNNLISQVKYIEQNYAY